MNRLALVVLFLIGFVTLPTAPLYAAVTDDRPVILQSIGEDGWPPFYYFTGPDFRLHGMMADLLDQLFVKELNWQPKAIIRPGPEHRWR